MPTGNQNTNLGFKHIAGALSTVTGAVAGEIYFSVADHTIGVYNGTTMEKYYGGKVANVAFADKKLTISYLDGSDSVELDFSDTASATGVNALLKQLRSDVDGKQAKLSDAQLAAANSGVTADKVSAYDTHVADTDIHVTAADKTTWSGKQDALANATVLSGITSDKVTAWDNKQDAIAENTYDAYGAAAAVVGSDADTKDSDTVKGAKLYAASVAATAEQNAKDYADGLASSYEVAGAAATAEQNAKDYADGLASNYDEAGAAQAVADTLGTAAAKNVLTGTIAESSSDDLVTAAQVKSYAAGVVGAMHFRGVATKEDLSDIADPANGDVALYGTKEYVYNGTAWVLFGDEGAYDVAGAAATAEQNAKDYADGLASNYDAAGSADTAEQNAKDYADGLASNYDAAGAADTAEQNAKDYADGLAGNYDASGAAATAEQNAKDYADGLATNYDAAGSAATAEQNAKDYADGLATNYDAAGAAATAKSDVIGASTDDKDADTINGAKAYADDAAANAVTNAMIWKAF